MNTPEETHPMTFDQAQKCGVIGMMPHDPPIPSQSCPGAEVTFSLSAHSPNGFVRIVTPEDRQAECFLNLPTWAVLILMDNNASKNNLSAAVARYSASLYDARVELETANDRIWQLREACDKAMNAIGQSPQEGAVIAILREALDAARQTKGPE